MWIEKVNRTESGWWVHRFKLQSRIIGNRSIQPSQFKNFCIMNPSCFSSLQVLAGRPSGDTSINIEFSAESRRFPVTSPLSTSNSPAQRHMYSLSTKRAAHCARSQLAATDVSSPNTTGTIPEVVWSKRLTKVTVLWSSCDKIWIASWVSVPAGFSMARTPGAVARTL